MLAVRKFSVVAQVNVGALTEKRTKLFHELVKEDFPIQDMNTPQGLVSVHHNGKGRIVMLTNQQISIAQTSTGALQPAEVDIDNAHTWMNRIFDADFMALDSDAQFAFTVEAVEHEDFHVGNRSRKNANLDLPSVSGVGFRVMLKEEDFIGDFRVEPLVQDPFYTYYELQLATKVPVSVTLVQPLGQKVISELQGKYHDYARTLLKDDER